MPVGFQLAVQCQSRLYQEHDIDSKQLTSIPSLLLNLLLKSLHENIQNIRSSGESLRWPAARNSKLLPITMEVTSLIVGNIRIDVDELRVWADREDINAVSVPANGIWAVEVLGGANPLPVLPGAIIAAVEHVRVHSLCGT